MLNNRVPPSSLVQEVVKKGGSFNITALGSSMTPVIWHRSIVTIKWAEPEDIKIGDIIAKGVGNKYMIHRVVRIKKLSDENNKECLVFLTKGDFLTYIDPFYNPDEYLGIVTFISNRFASFNPNSVPYFYKVLCVYLSVAGSFFGRLFYFVYRLIYKFRLLQLIFRTILSFPVLIINTLLIIYYSVRR